MPTLNFRDIPQTPLTRALGLIIDDYGYDGSAESGCTWLTGHIDAGPEHHQPVGIVHGAVYTGAVETAASVGPRPPFTTAASTRWAWTTSPTSSAR